MKKIIFVLLFFSVFNSFGQCWQSLDVDGDTNNIHYAIQNDGTLWELTFNNLPTQLGFGNSWKHCYTASNSTFLIASDSTLWGFGDNYNGQLGIGNTNYQSTLIQLNNSKWISLTSSFYTGTTAIKEDGTIWYWGQNGSNPIILVPTQIGTDNDWKEIHTSFSNVIALKNNGTLWYGNVGGPLTQVGSDSDWSYIWAAPNFNSWFGVKNNGTMWKDGVQIGTDSDWNLVKSIEYNTYAIKNNGSVWFWDYQSDVFTASPVQINQNTSFKDITIGNGYIIYAVSTSGELYNGLNPWAVGVPSLSKDTMSNYLCASVAFQVFNDPTQQCSVGSGIQGITVSVTPRNYVTTTDQNGFATISNLPDGNYTAIVDTTGQNWASNCPTTIGFQVINGFEPTDSNYFYLFNTNPPPSFTVGGAQTICAGTSAILTAVSNPTTAVYNYQWSTSPVSNQNGVTNSSVTVSPTSTTTYTVTATDPVTGYSSSQNITVFVNPIPTVNPLPDVNLCNGTMTPPFLFTGGTPGTDFSWTNSNPSIGLSGSGIGNIPSFFAINNSSVPVVSVITVVPSFTNNGLTCVGIPQIFTITILPTPIMNFQPDLEFCNNQTTNPILFTGGFPGTTSFWTNSNPSIGIGSNGNGDIPPFLAINNTTNPITATILVTSATTWLGLTCFGNTDAFLITVNPTPAVSISYSPQTCSTNSIWGVNFTGANSANLTGTFSSVPNGLSLNATTGAITPSTSLPGTYTVTFTGSCSQVMASTTITIGQLGSFSIAVFNDLDQNCSQNAETGIAGLLVSIQPGNLIASSNTNGIASFANLPDGTYTATIDTTNLNWSTTCPVSQTFSIQNGVADCIGFGLFNTNPCTDPNVSIFAPSLTSCSANQMVYVSACNQSSATGVLSASYVDVELDPLMTVTASSLPYTVQGNNVFRFQTGNINPGQCVNFNITTTISCNSFFSQTLCMDARLYPVQSCVLDTVPSIMASGVTPCNLPWDQSSLSVNGWCQGDSVYFTITNTGQLGGGDMECFSPVRIYVDGVLTYFDSIMINGGATVTYSYFGNGQTWILQADQHPLHPGNSHPNAHVEACGDPANWIPDIVNEFPQDDADAIVDIYCGLVTTAWQGGPWDPNDKTGFPLGIGQSHDILPNTDLQYVIRFQNTGTDTAITVVIRDTLDTDLNIFTVTSGVSSHNYSFTMHGPRVLEWTFENINLPDSTTNEPESHGFVTFEVQQVPNLPAGTEINNNVGIYFDFNAPVITNTTLHTINPCINKITETINSSTFACSTYTAPNGQVLSESGDYQIISQDANGCNTIHNISLSISTFEATAILIGSNTLQASLGVSYQWLDCSTGQYITSETNQSVVVSDGVYAVIVSDGQCSDQSDCITVNTIGIEEGELSLNLHPNPSNGLVIVEALGIQPSEYTIQSMDGRIIHSGLLHNGLTALDLNHFSNGNYLFNSNGKQIRFVISK